MPMLALLRCYYSWEINVALFPDSCTLVATAEYPEGRIPVVGNDDGDDGDEPMDTIDRVEDTSSSTWMEH